MRGAGAVLLGARSAFSYYEVDYQRNRVNLHHGPLSSPSSFVWKHCGLGADHSHHASGHWRKQSFIRDASLDPPARFGVFFS